MKFRVLPLLLSVLVFGVILNGCTAFPTRPNDFFRRTFHFTPSPTILGSPQFERAMDYHTRSRLIGGNTAEFLANGEAVYSAMLAAIDAATATIDLTVYTFSPDEIGKEFIVAMTKAALRGVDVRVIYDAYGSPQLRKKAPFTEFIAAGGKLRVFNPYHSWTILRANNRNHRKVLTIDGQIAFMGGLNVADHFRGEDAWNDLMLCVRGNVVAEVEQVFNQAWQQAGGGFFGRNLPFWGTTGVKNVLEFPVKKLVAKLTTAARKTSTRARRNDDADAVTPAGNNDTLAIRVVEQSPEWLNSYIINLYEYAILSAQRRIYICTPYFVPPLRLMRALKAARARGVEIKILTQGLADVEHIQRLSRQFIVDLQSCGVAVYGWHKNILHAKYMVVDDEWLTIGSANLDGRSLYLNYEANFALYAPPLARTLSAIFLQDINAAKTFVPATVREAPFYLRAIKYHF